MLLALPALARGASEPFPEPSALEPAVRFWTRVYLDSTTDGGLLHDARELGVVYEIVRFEGVRDSRAQQRKIDARKRFWNGVLADLARGRPPAHEGEEAVVRMLSEALGRTPRASDYLAARDRLRFQLGQRDKFRAGLIRAGAYDEEMRATFRDLSLPEDLAYLPHVESSFNVAAYSKYGAAGVWQFMRSTGRRYLKIDYVVDERLDPIRATQAAARLLRDNYRILRSWPLAITAYNHGAAGMQRARRKLGTDRIDVIVERYNSRTFGFASRNFYAQFLAARRIARDYERHFGPLRRDEPEPVDEIQLPFFTSVADLQRYLGVSPDVIRQLNPALRPPVFRSDKRIPKGYALRLPAGSVGPDQVAWASRIPSTRRHADQHHNSYHVVKRGETLSRIAQRHKTSIGTLVALNNLPGRHRIYPGQVLQLPGAGSPPAPDPTPGLVSVAHAAPAEPPAEPVAEALPAPAIVAATELGPEAASPVVAPAPAAKTLVEALEPAATLAALEPAPALIPVTPPAPAPASPPAPEPGAATAAAAVPPAVLAVEDDPFRRVHRDRVRVDLDETLGHYAEWLEVSAGRLRALNRLSRRSPLRVGQELKLDFSRVPPEQFTERRLEYHKSIEEDFFGSYKITGTVTHHLRRGESLWLISHKIYAVPTWLIRRYNPDLDLSRLVPGTTLQIPIAEKLSS
jgi:membrane-bound lytic murein transglycosylase D